MRWCLFVVCVSIGVVSVNSGCIDGPHSHGFEEDTKDLKDVEWIGKDLKYKLDHGINKELSEKKGHFGEAAGFDKAHHLTGEQADIAVKKLHSMLGEDFKMEDLSEQDFKALASFLEHLSAESQGELFAKKEVSEKESFLKGDDHSFKDADAVKKVSPHSLFDSAAEDVSSYLAESVLQMSKNQDASKYHHGSDEMLHKKLEEMKDLRSEEADSHYAMSDEEKAYFKEVSGSEKGFHHEKGEKSLEDEALKKFMKLISDAAHHEEGSALLKEIIEHPDDESMEEVFKELAKKLYSEKGIGKEDHELKVVGHEFHLKEGAHGLDKDLVYDEILKKEDGKIYGEEKLYGMKKSVDFDEHGKVVRGIKADEAAKTVSVRSAEAKKSKEGGKEEIHDILKEEKYYISGGTHAYEAARDQAHVDSKVPPTIDEANKPIDTHKIFLSEEGAKKVYHDEEHLFDESALKKDKGVHETKYAYGEETRKSMFDHGIGEEIAGEKKYIDGSLKGKEIYGEDHLFKTEEIHLMKGHHGKDDAIAVEKPHHGPLDLKKKFMMLMKRMLRMKKCYLVSMPPSELLGIIDCISRSKNPSLCEKFAMCEKKMPLQVILAQEKCQKEIIAGEVKRCSAFEPLYPSREIPLKIFKCIVKNTTELNPEEKKQMIDFEECARQVKVESCGRIPWG